MIKRAPLDYALSINLEPYSRNQVALERCVQQAVASKQVNVRKHTAVHMMYRYDFVRTIECARYTVYSSHGSLEMIRKQITLDIANTCVR